MGVEEAGWAGLYLADLPQPHATLLAGGTLRLRDRSYVEGELVTADVARLSSEVVVASDLDARVAAFIGPALIDGDVRVNEIRGVERATIGGTLTVGVPISVPPVELVEVEPGSTPVVVQWDRSAVLPPGQYGSARFHDRSTVYLSAGNYAFRSFRAGNDVTFVLDASDGSIVVDVEKSIRFGDRNQFTTSCDGMYPTFLYTNGTATFGFDGYYEAFVSAQGNISIRDRTTFFGSAHSNGSVTLGFDTGFIQP